MSPDGRTGAVMLAGLAVLAGMLAGCTASQVTASPAANTLENSAPATPIPTAPATAHPKASQVLPVAPGAGALPQTETYPSIHDTAWRNAMHDLWLAVTRGKPRDAMPAFFPELAYAQVKAIAYPRSDWENRLWADFALDVLAAHALVGPHAKLLQVIMAPSSEAAWIPTGYCYNSAGYWHINGARLVYLKDGQERSIGIASLISWRGVWYVVHFGGVIRPAVGLVDDPETGTGIPGPAGGC
ncbi:MAG TPA: hypothetical protein VKU39_22095 [Streptosporangiaceae bacterium]|nr:hypothetical protein [Streptosporangiaceae bacterium]